MAIAQTLGVALAGLAGQVVEVQADLSAGLPGLTFTGLPDTSVLEARDRIRAAVLNSGAEWPNRRITLALLPADVRKIGSRFDLAMAVAVLAAAGRIRVDAVADVLWLAELGLDGRLRPVRGVLPAVIAARQAGVRRVVVSSANAAEATLVDAVDIRAADDLAQVLAWLQGAGPPLPAAEPGVPELDRPGHSVDLADVAGQGTAKRALEVAAAGGHHVYLVGVPGAGKSMLAERLPGLLPALDDDVALEATAVQSVAGALGRRGQLVRRAPFQAPHHTATAAALVGGGSGIASPGAISLAHGGVLFLDEAPEFAPAVLEALRQPLEKGRITLHRSGGAACYPARFLLVLAANPCPCGQSARLCACPPAARRRYQHRLSGPLLDRVDLRIAIEPVPHAELVDDVDGRENSATVAARVSAARAAAAARWAADGWRLNGAVPGAVLRRRPWRLPRAALHEVEAYVDRGQLSARGYDRVLRMAWTVSDLCGHATPDAGDVAEAMFFRLGRAESWAA
jgi:magnesium chelatase family protein